MTRPDMPSTHGEGTGGPSREVVDPNDPSFDPAAHETTTDAKIRELLSIANDSKLQPWERQLLIRSYGQVPLPRRAHVTIAKIHKRLLG